MQARSKSHFKGLAAIGVVVLFIGYVRADSLWTDDPKLSLVADKKAHAVGDIITVVVQENNTTTKDSKTETAKQTSMNTDIKSFLYSPAASGLLSKKGKLPAFDVSSDNKFSGGGKINNNETIGARFGVRVVDVLPNGNLIIEGQRMTQFSGEAQTIILRGTVRQYDVGPSNTVFSYNLADVSISFVNTGTINNSQRKGWFSKAWDVLSPF